MGAKEWDDIKRVRDEAERILRAPYDVSLKASSILPYRIKPHLPTNVLQSPKADGNDTFQKFRDILGQISRESLQLWSSGNLCQIYGLAAIVVDSLEQSLLSIELLQVLCVLHSNIVHLPSNQTNEWVCEACIPSFCDAALKRQPVLLHTLMTKATSSESLFGKYARICISLLSASSPLPDPAILPRLLTTLLHKAVQTPTTGNIRLVYDVVSGPKSELLNMMPPDLLIELQEHLLNILRALEAADHSANLLCLAILAKLASADLTNLESLGQPLGSDVSPPDTSSSSEPNRASVVNCSSAKHFFTAKRASKTLDLVVLKVILACSRSCSLSSSEIIESLQLSEEIVDAVDKDEKRTWMLKNSFKSRKLLDKVLRPDIDIGVRCVAINFINSLMEGQPLSSELVEVFPNLLRVSTPVFLTRRSIERYLMQCDESTISAVVLEVLELACSECRFDGPSLNRLNKATYLVSNLTTEIQTSARLRQIILYSLSTNAFADPTRRFLRHAVPILTPEIPHDSSGICPILTLQANSDLSKSLCVLFTKTAMYSSQDEISLDSSVAAGLLDKHIKLLETPIVRCDSYISRPIPSVTGPDPLYISGELRTEQLSSRNWRESLLRDMSTAAQHQHNSVVNVVSEICQDLEARCHSAERPWREATARSDELEFKLRGSEAALATLETQMKERILVLNALEAENHRLVEHVDNAEQRLQELSSTNEQLSHCLDCVKRDYVESAECAREKEEQEKLVHLAIVTGKDENYEKQALKLAEAEARATSLEVELSHNNALNESNLGRLEDSVSIINQKYEVTKALAASRETEIARHLEYQAKMVREKQDLELKVIHQLTQYRQNHVAHKTQWKEFEAQRELLSTELNAKIEAIVNERANLLLEHDASLVAINTEIQQQRDSYESTIQKLREELNKVKQDDNAAAKSSEKSLADAHRKIMNLRCEREAKAKEFAEVKDLSSRLMEVMGMDRIRTATRSSTQRTRSNHSSSSQTGPGVPKVKPAADSRHPLVTNAANPTGPTTKRTKMHRSSESFEAQSPNSYTPASFRSSSEGVVDHEVRFPLQEIKFSPSKQIAVIPFQPLLRTCSELQDVDNDERGKENEDIVFAEGQDNCSFGDSDIFTGTDHHRYSGIIERSMTGFDDDITVDI